MPLVKTVLERQIYAAFKRMSNNTSGDLNGAQKELAKDLATAIGTYIKSATVITPPGQPVATAGSPAAQTGATVAPSPPATIS